VAYDDRAANATCGNRRKGLAHLLGIRETEAQDQSLAGRLAIVAKLRAARQGEISRGQSGSWLYDVNRHLNLCAALRAEYEALADFLANDRMDRSGLAASPNLQVADVRDLPEDLHP
jgi:hypothetical protein